jgi:hypothetical protein
MPDLRAHAVKIAEAAASAWWKAHGSSRDEIPLGVVAALALTTQADPSGPDPARLILGADRDDIADLLRHIWTLFAIIRPELSIWVGSFAAWETTRQRCNLTPPTRQPRPWSRLGS